MPKATFTEPFKYAIRGIEVVEYEAGKEYDVDAECVRVAKEEGILAGEKKAKPKSADNKKDA